MKRAFALGATLFWVLTAPALAQVYPGEEVTVNPNAIGNGYLLYPGGKYGRFVGHLLQPGERRGTIHLHLPVKHKVVARHVPKKTAPAAAMATETAPVTSPDQFASAPDMGGPAPVPPKRVAHRTSPKPAAMASAPPPTADVGSVPEDSAARLVGPMADAVAPPPPKPRRTAAAPTPAPDAGAGATTFTVREVSGAPGPRRTASANPPPASLTPSPATAAGLRKQSMIPFAPGASSPAAQDVNAVHALATALNAQLGAGAQHVQINAYGGPRGDKSSDAHRLSLKRALVIRELLIEDGVPAEKIDVRALGGVDDSGPADRVDVFVQA
jgi:outer membrane protein OmpA-like peptidoglycan-associated protein